MTIPAAVTVHELGLHLGMTPASPRYGDLGVYAAAATEALETGECAVGALVERTVVGRVTIQGGTGLLPIGPGVSVTSVVDAAGVTRAAADFTVYPSGVVTGPDGVFTVTYTAGRSATAAGLPQSYRLAILIVAEHLWQTQRGNGARGRSDDVIPAGFAIPNRARQLVGGIRDLPVA